MKKDIGFFSINLQNLTIHDDLCNLVHSYIADSKNNQIVIFNQYCEKIDTQNIPIFPLSYSKFFQGDLVTFDIASLLIAVDSARANNIYYYTNTIPWQQSYNNYTDWKYIFKHPKLKIIAQNDFIHNIYNIVWENSLGICEDISYEKFCKFI